MATLGLSRIHQISMRAHDVERATKFYRDTLVPRKRINWK